MSTFSIALILFLIMDSIGNLNSYLSLTKEISTKRQSLIVIREMLIALLVMFSFNYLSPYIFSVLDLSETTVRLSSGVILFLIAIKILFPSPTSLRANLPPGEPFIFPLAVPLIAGPALLATILLYSHLEACQPCMLGAILIAWFFSVVILFFAKPIKQVLGQNGLTACERLIGMVLVIVSVQRFLEGILLFWSTHSNPA